MLKFQGKPEHKKAEKNLSIKHSFKNPKTREMLKMLKLQNQKLQHFPGNVKHVKDVKHFRGNLKANLAPPGFP